MKKPTQHERILEAFRKAPDNKLSMRYIERELFISQATARISELRGKGYTIVPVDTDEFGFSVQQLQGAPVKLVQKVMQKFDEKGRPCGVTVSMVLETSGGVD